MPVEIDDPLVWIDLEMTGLDLNSGEPRQTELLAFIKTWVPNSREGILAGNSVHVDRSFLIKDFPSVADHLHYRIVDVSTVKELARRWHPKAFENAPPKALSHRALDDILESIAELQHYRETVYQTTS